MKMKPNLKRGLIAAAAIATLAFAATPAQAGADLAIGVTLGSPYYYAPPPPPPAYYETRVVYEEPVYYERRVVYEHEWCPHHRAYHGAHVHHRHHRHHHWD
jgi:hypothetical protein